MTKKNSDSRALGLRPAVEQRPAVQLGLAASAVLLTRLPWIGSGYGSDPDGYRVVIAARQIARSGVYETSRFPGYPVYEYLTVLSATAAPWVSNLVTALLSVAAFVLFALIARELGIRRHLLLALAFALTPVVYVNSSCTMDYVPALAAQLAATYAVLRRRPLLGGAFLGAAVGCRITAGALALPLCLWMLMSQAQAQGRAQAQAQGHAQPQGRAQALRQILPFGVTLLGVSVLCFLPVWWRYGFDFFSFYDNDSFPPFDVVYARAVPLVWGPLGAAVLLGVMCAAGLYYRHAMQRLAEARTRNAVVLAAVAMALYLVAFLRLPDEAGYLIPIVPFVLLLVGLLAPPWAVGALAVSLLLSPWIGFEHGVPNLYGPVVEDHLVRQSQQRQTQAIIGAVAHLPGRAVIVSGWVLPRLMLALGGDQEGSHRFVYLVEDIDDLRHYRDEGWQLYFLPGVDLYEAQAHDLELAALGARQLDVPSERQRPASTGE